LNGISNKYFEIRALWKLILWIKKYGTLGVDLEDKRMRDSGSWP